MYQLPGYFTDSGCLQGPVIPKQVGSVSFNVLKQGFWEYLGGLVVTILGSHSCGLSSVPGQGNRCHKPCGSAKNK